MGRHFITPIVWLARIDMTTSHVYSIGMKPLTEKQNAVLRFVREEVRRSGIPPTVREIARHFKVFPKAIQDHLAALERKGALQRAKDLARGLIVEVRRAARRQLPILGR